MAKLTREELKAATERKVLGEDAWITLEGDASEPKIRIRVDYPTQGQAAQIDRLERALAFAPGVLQDFEHPDLYFMRAAIKEVRNLTVDGDPYPAKLGRDNLAEREIVDLLVALGLYNEALTRTRLKLYVGLEDKKKSSSSASSSPAAN